MTVGNLKNIKKIQFLIEFILVITYVNNFGYATNTTVNKVITLVKENQILDKEIIKLMRLELSEQVKNISKVILKDDFNHLWLFKVYKSSIPVNNSIAAYQIACLFGIKTPCLYEIVLPINGKMVYGSIQRFINNAYTISDVDPWMLSLDQIKVLQRHQVLDYFVCNPDVGGDNFLLKRGTKEIFSIDNDECFYEILDSLQDVWNNNPYYRRLWNAYVEKKIDVDFSKSFQLIDYTQKIDAKKIECLLNPFFYGREAFLKKIVFRKDELRGTFEKFYQDLANKRGEYFQSQVDIKAEEEYTRIVLKKIEKIVFKKKKWLRSLQSKPPKKQKNIKIIFSQEAFNKMITLEDTPTENIFIVAEKILNQLQYLKKETISVYEKFTIVLYMYAVKDILRERSLEYFLNKPINAIIKVSCDVNIYSLEYTMRTFYEVSRQLPGKILNEIKNNSQNVLKHLSLIQNILNKKEKEIIFRKYKKQIGNNSLVNFIGGMLFRETKYLERIKDNFGWKYLGKGMLYWLYEDRDEAMQEYGKAITLSDDKTINFFGYRLRGFIYEHNSKRVRFGKGFDVDSAITNYEKALEIKSDSMEVRLNLASLYLIKHLPVKALKNFKEIQKIDPQYAAKHFHFENIRKISEYKKEEDYLEAVKKNTLSAEHYYLLGLAYAVKGKNVLAKKHFIQAREFGYKGDVNLE